MSMSGENRNNLRTAIHNLDVMSDQYPDPLLGNLVANAMSEFISYAVLAGAPISYSQQQWYREVETISVHSRCMHAWFYLRRLAAISSCVKDKRGDRGLEACDLQSLLPTSRTPMTVEEAWRDVGMFATVMQEVTHPEESSVRLYNPFVGLQVDELAKSRIVTVAQAVTLAAENQPDRPGRFELALNNPREVLKAWWALSAVAVVLSPRVETD